MKKHISTILLTAVLLIGLSLLLYPTFSDWWNSFRQSRVIDSYTQSVAALSAETYDTLWSAAREYNDSLLTRQNSFLLSPQQQEAYETLLNTEGNGIMGYVQIPSIGVTLPVYHGTGDGVLQVAAGHLEWTSLPVGGESSHCVISGHRGLPSARLFTDLDKLETGDLFVLHVLGQALSYQVDQVCVVEPFETEELLIREGEDLCTLVTCTPYGINSHRLLVRGCRVENQAPRPQVHLTTDAVKIPPATAAAVGAIPILLLMLLFLLLPGRKHGGGKNEIV